MNVIILLISLDGLMIIICKFKRDLLMIIDLIKYGIMSFEVVVFLWVFVDGFGVKLVNVFVVGGIGLGKIIIFNFFGMFIFFSECVISIEDIVEF